MDTKKFKRSLQQSAHYHRKGFGYEYEIMQTMNMEYQSSLIQRMRQNNYQWQNGKVTIHLAKAFGFCWGVERAVAMAYETRKHFPNKSIWITNEIIHNPSVNRQLLEMDVDFIEVVNNDKDFSAVKQGDVVILPAFGASISEIELLNNKGCTIVDTTCPWVSKVWNSVEKHKKRNYTSIIHGKYLHEETVATSSFAGDYLVILNLEQANYVCNYILNGGNKKEFLDKFKNAHSAGFNPDSDLEKLGIANQTTMLKSETEQISQIFEETIIKKYGKANLRDYFMSFNTICDATQERQDAMLELVKHNLDLMVVIGGFNSSNTTHLQEIAIGRQIPSYHIDDATCIKLDNSIEHKPLGKDLKLEKNWLQDDHVKIGITSGASTPDIVVEEVINNIFAIKTNN
ncbi:4-hydroxy-3-methylbut-2-enyl diphosphate reductase [Cyanobacterium sp. uoEpiScrs1]|uniref:4-hydroxy-3-methylbut-2-enyl diphosphate reductase n=1 Tax=Cyanobacterium sp. uoEpiScrs1 TaxID=2976343 RepID=UPI002269EC59|nr:4-hydroxy-3-methylbut-2-enyl diphosphate reductase [Cyanobacterium sp. uoEpiScrs1]